MHSPTYLGGLWDTAGCAIVDPARLAWGLRRACLEAGVRIYEHTPVTGIADDGGRPGRERLLLATPDGAVRGRAGRAGHRRVRRRCCGGCGYYLVPVYDYVLMTEPLSAAQLASIGWQDRQGWATAANQFHYYRLTRDNRILWGGYDAVYYYGSRIVGRAGPAAGHVRDAGRGTSSHTFPQLEGLTFSHALGRA